MGGIHNPPVLMPSPLPCLPPSADFADEKIRQTEQDQVLVRQFVGGDETAFLDIMAKYRAKIYSVAFDLLHNRCDAEEITQDTFMRAYRALARFRGDSSLSTWLHRIAVNLARNRYWHCFRRRRHMTLSLDAALREGEDGTFADRVVADTPDPSQESSRDEFSRLVEQCMAALEPRHRDILHRRNVLNQSYSEIAADLGINVGTVKSRIARARENLREQIAEVCPEFSPESDATDWFQPSRHGVGLSAISA